MRSISISRMSDTSLTPVSDVHRRAIIVDGHCDTPYRLKRLGIHIDEHHTESQLDFRLLQASGITASFFAAYVPPFYAGRGAAKFANELIDLVYQEAARHPETLFVGQSAGDIRDAKSSGKIALMIGIEGGHAIEDSLEQLRAFYDRGVRYLTLTHVNTNNWADSSADEPRHGGLTSFGREVVTTMNDLGMLVDISHVSDQAFEHAIETSRVPIIASHSSCRALTNHPRNLTDDMLRTLARNGGICMINFFSAFVDERVAQDLIRAQKGSRHNKGLGSEEELPDDRIDWDEYLGWFTSLGCPVASLDDLIDHIVHAVSVAGIDHVGIGSDFDGVPSLPQGLTDASCLPALTGELIKRGFADEEIGKILGKNFLRVFDLVEKGRRIRP